MVGELVGGVDEDEIVGVALAREEGEGVAAHDPRSRQAQLLQVALDRTARVSVGLDEDGPGRPAREGFEAHRAGTGVQIEHGGAVDRADQVEGGLPDAVGGGPGREALRRLDRVTLAAPGDDSHRHRIA